MLIDGVRLLIWEISATPAGQVGLHAFGNGAIAFKDFDVEPRQKRAFLVMPFADELTTEYLTVKLAESERNKFKIERLDESPNPGKITNEILERIDQADAVIGVLTWIKRTQPGTDNSGSLLAPNENVYYELGYAHALKKPTILVALKGTHLPFDLRVDKVIFYERTTNGMLALRTEIDQALQSIADL